MLMFSRYNVYQMFSFLMVKLLKVVFKDVFPYTLIAAYLGIPYWSTVHLFSDCYRIFTVFDLKPQILLRAPELRSQVI